jgi:hypothetical protein
MPRSRLRDIQAEWNSLVPQASGLSRVRLWTSPPANIVEGETRLNWLKAQLLSRASTFGLTFGTELESILPNGTYHSHLRTALIGAGIAAEVEHLNHRVATHWKITTDGSLGNNTRGTETVSPILQGDDGFANLRTVCQTLTSVGARITSRCGLHVHVGVRDQGSNPIFFKRLIKLYASYEPIMDAFMAASRRGNANNYAESITRFVNPTHPSRIRLDAANTLAEVMAAYGREGGSKYRKLNLLPFFSYGTVEFRHHQGSTDPIKVENWVRLCLRMVTACKRAEFDVDMANAMRTLAGFMELIQASESEQAYFAGRTAHFSNHAN